MSGITDLVTYVKGQTDSVGASGSATQAAAGSQLQKRRIQIRLLADAAAGTTGTYNLADIGNVGGTVTRITVVPEAALTADPTNNATITYQVVNGSGGGAQAISTALTTNAGGSGNWVASTRVTNVALTATTANRSWVAASFPNGAVIQENIAKGGTGVIVPARTVTIEFTEDA